MAIADQVVLTSALRPTIQANYQAAYVKPEESRNLARGIASGFKTQLVEVSWTNSTINEFLYDSSTGSGKLFSSHYGDVEVQPHIDFSELLRWFIRAESLKDQHAQNYDNYRQQHVDGMSERSDNFRKLNLQAKKIADRPDTAGFIAISKPQVEAIALSYGLVLNPLKFKALEKRLDEFQEHLMNSKLQKLIGEARDSGINLVARQPKTDFYPQRDHRLIGDMLELCNNPLLIFNLHVTQEDLKFAMYNMGFEPSSKNLEDIKPLFDKAFSNWHGQLLGDIALWLNYDFSEL